MQDISLYIFLKVSFCVSKINQANMMQFVSFRHNPSFYSLYKVTSRETVLCCEIEMFVFVSLITI